MNLPEYRPRITNSVILLYLMDGKASIEELHVEAAVVLGYTATAVDSSVARLVDCGLVEGALDRWSLTEKGRIEATAHWEMFKRLANG